jgi:hypothetical protein
MPQDKVSASNRNRDLKQSHSMRTKRRPIAIINRNHVLIRLPSSRRQMEFSEVTSKTAQPSSLTLGILSPNQPERSFRYTQGQENNRAELVKLVGDAGDKSVGAQLHTGLHVINRGRVLEKSVIDIAIIRIMVFNARE